MLYIYYQASAAVIALQGKHYTAHHNTRLASHPRYKLGDLFVTNRSRQQCSPWVDGHRLGSIVGLVDAHKPVCQLKHVVAQTNDHKLRILGALLNIVCNDGHILEICRHKHASGNAQGCQRADASRFHLRTSAQRICITVQIVLYYAGTDRSAAGWLSNGYVHRADDCCSGRQLPNMKLISIIVGNSLIGDLLRSQHSSK